MLVWPDSCSFTFKPSKKKEKWKNGKETGNQLYDFVYIESFTNPDERLMQNTLAMVAPIKEIEGLKVGRYKKNGFKISGTATRERLADIVTGEFFAQSSMGKMTMENLWQAASVGAIYAEKLRQEQGPNPKVR